MKTIKTKITVLLLLIIASISCSKDEETPIVETTYLSKEGYSFGSFTYNYNPQNKLENVVFTSTNPSVNPSYTFTITNNDSSGRITGATYNYDNPIFEDALVENTYNSEGKLVVVVYKNSTTLAQTDKTVIEYMNNQIKHFDYNGTNTLLSSKIYTLSTDNKNVIELKRFNTSGTLLSINAYSNFDTKKSPFSLVPSGFLVTPNRENNHGTDTYTVISSGAVTTSTLTFEYNSDGYATKRTTSSGSISTFEYIKK